MQGSGSFKRALPLAGTKGGGSLEPTDCCRGIRCRLYVQELRSGKAV